MKIVDWFKNLLSKKKKKDYMLNESNADTYEQKGKTDFVPKVDVNVTETKKSREDILRALQEDIIIENLSEEYNYDKFSNENIRINYDTDSILSDEDIAALSCLYGAIKDGNKRELNMTDNKINTFLKQNPNNIVVLVNLMLKDAKSMYETLDSELARKTSVQGLIPGSYADISEIIESYNKENDLLI